MCVVRRTKLQLGSERVINYFMFAKEHRKKYKIQSILLLVEQIFSVIRKTVLNEKCQKSLNPVLVN